MHWLYVYYRLPQAEEALAVEAASRLFAQLDAQRLDSGRPPLKPALLRRPELRDGDITFMEVYGPLPAEDIGRLKSELSVLLTGIPVLAAAARHTEEFVALSCA